MKCGLCGFEMSPIEALVRNHFRDVHQLNEDQLDDLCFVAGDIPVFPSGMRLDRAGVLEAFFRWQPPSSTVQKWYANVYKKYLPSSEA